MFSKKILYVVIAIVFFVYLGIIAAVHIFAGSSFYKAILKLPNSNTLFFLNGTQDYRYVYFYTKPLRVSFYVPAGSQEKLPNSLMATFSATLSSVYSVDAHDRIILKQYPPHAVWSDKDLKDFANKNKDGELSVFFVNSLESDPSRIAMLVDHRSLFIFRDPIEKTSLSTADSNDLTTLAILHEFGYLLGFSRIEDPLCVMSRTYETSTKEYYKPVLSPPFELCEQDRLELRKALL
jgi:hypothetical protein